MSHTTALRTTRRRSRGRTALGSLNCALESLNFRARTTGQDAAARSRFVRRLRIALPILALVLVASSFFLINTQSNTVDEAFLEDFKDHVRRID